MAPKPILTAHLFPKIEAALLELLRSLTREDWERPTLAPAWNVKDVAAHLLDTQLRKLSVCRDRVPSLGGEVRPDVDVIAFINRLNAAGVSYYRRLSPAVLQGREFRWWAKTPTSDGMC